MKTPNPSRLIANVDRASVEYADTDIEWGAIKSEIIDHYPRFNSRSFWPVECPLCHELHDVQLSSIYKGHFICKQCHNRTKFAPAGQAAASSSESQRKTALTRLANGDRHLSTPEVRRKAAITSGNLLKSHAPEVRAKAWVTRKSSL